MKELLFPWNNWHSGESEATYLQPGTPGVWPVVAQLGEFGQLTTAEQLKVTLLGANRRFNTKRLAAAIERQPGSDAPKLNAAGRGQVLDGKRLLTPLFKTTEVNLVSAREKSGVHFFDPDSAFIPAKTIKPPDSAFLNVALIAGGGFTGHAGLQIAEARGFGALASLTQQENKDFLTAASLGMLGEKPKDAEFAWFGVEASFIDNDMVDQCLKLGVITPHFLAAVLAVDLEKPVFSEKRAGLLEIIPARFEFTPRSGGVPDGASHDAAKDHLSAAVIQKLEAAAPAAGSTEAEFLALLRSANAVPLLKDRVVQYRDRVKAALAGGDAGRKAELKRLFERLVKGRQQMREHAQIGPIIESSALFPMP